ncbi:MAG TPA: iron chelate uptake ABC transporter family permease subunit, partial [Actinomycetota bacterium]|nr:iron chelate uptake ABC transporter family permease subunit [Actinomycetota bacterium]
MRPGGRRYRTVIAVLAILLVASVLVAVAAGSVGISPLTTVRLVAWKFGLADRPYVPVSTEVILFQLRLPRVILAVIVGLALAIAGTLFQGLFRNPLADPAIVGVSSGAALGAIAVIVAGGGALFGGLGVSLAAFVGGMVTATFVYRLARVGPAVNVATLLLAGIAVAAVISAVMSLVMSFAGEEIRSIYFWLLGGLSARGWSAVEVVGPLILLGSAGAVLLIRDLNLVSLGEERAAQLGMDVDRFKWQAVALGALLAGAAVSVAGVIGFVGLMTPHVMRLVVGADHRRLLPAVLLAGPVFLVLADLVARVVIAPQELPLGAVTALVGGPFFLYLLRRERG